MRFRIDVVVRRGAIAESSHRIHAAVCGVEGALAAGAGQPLHRTTFRSAAKPFQLLPLVERGHADRFGFGEEELAVMAASHTGSEPHVRLVKKILERIGLSDRDLACGYHEPFDPVAAEQLRRHPDSRSPLYNNCSGKHAGFLALALAEGWPTMGYELEDHPLQQLMRRTVAEVAGYESQELSVAVDGCGVSVFGLPLTGMARSYALLAAADSGSGASAVPGTRGGTAGARGAGLEPARIAALARIRCAMQRHAWATGGVGRLSTELMARTGGRLVAKGGAEGLECVGIPERGMGLALKCEDGGARAVGPAVLALLDRLNVLCATEREALGGFRRAVLRNHAGTEVGSVAVEMVESETVPSEERE